MTAVWWMVGIGLSLFVAVQILGLLMAVGRWVTYARMVRSHSRVAHVRRTQRLQRAAGLLLVVALLVPTLLGAASWADGSYTTQQTGTTLWAPQAGHRVVITSIDIQCGGSTAGNVMVWYGALADVTFTQGTDQPVTFFDCNTPSSTNTPTKVVTFDSSLGGTAQDFLVKVTTSSALTVRVIAQGYEQ